MFMCKQCWQQFEDSELAYTLILENRLTHPSPELFEYKFCSKLHVQQFLEEIKAQQQRYILTKKGKDGDKKFEPDYPQELLLLVGSSKG